MGAEFSGLCGICLCIKHEKRLECTVIVLHRVVHLSLQFVFVVNTVFILFISLFYLSYLFIWSLFNETFRSSINLLILAVTLRTTSSNVQ
jgi:hypothetical protein